MPGEADAPRSECDPGARSGRADGRSPEHHRFLLRELLTLIETQDRSIKHLELEIERHLHPFEVQVKRCEKITGVSRDVLHVLLAEVGTDLSRFPDAEHRSIVGGSLSWAEGKCR